MQKSRQFQDVRKQGEGMKKETHTISFRLDTHYLLQLEEAASRSGVSLHEQARRLVIDSLNRTDSQAEVLEQLASLRQDLVKVGTIEGQIQELRDDLAEAVEWMSKKIASR